MHFIFVVGLIGWYGYSLGSKMNTTVLFIHVAILSAFSAYVGMATDGTFSSLLTVLILLLPFLIGYGIAYLRCLNEPDEETNFSLDNDVEAEDDNH